MVQVTVEGNGNFFTVDEGYVSFATPTGTPGSRKTAVRLYPCRQAKGFW